MRVLFLAKAPSASSPKAERGFTLIELLAVIAIIAILAAILLPALSSAKERSRGIYCLNNTRQLTLAWQLYADDHEGFLPYNLVLEGTPTRTNINWVNGVLDWSASTTDNTNLSMIKDASLGSYVAGMTAIYHCPSDHVLSPEQQAAGWDMRVRSYSMNGMVGNAGNANANGGNVNNPGYKQFFKIEQMPRPTDIFVFLDEHPDSIDDGYFIDHDAASSPTSWGINAQPTTKWQNLPASYHNRAAAFSFADGHASLHRWVDSSTFVPAAPYALNTLQSLPGNSINDFEWVMDHMSVEN